MSTYAILGCGSGGHVVADELVSERKELHESGTDIRNRVRHSWALKTYSINAESWSVAFLFQKAAHSWDERDCKYKTRGGRTV